MKTRSFLFLLLLLLPAANLSILAQGTEFNGEWKLNTEKTQLPSDQLYLLRVNVKIDGNSMLLTRTYSDPNGQEYPFEENLTLDGKESKTTVYDMPRTSKAVKNGDGTITIESVTTFYANGGEENLTAKEVWKVDKEFLVIEMLNKMMGNELSSVNWFNKVK
jgi:hypothetical protein